MKITHYLYNAFIIESNGIRVAIDPGQNLWIFKLRSLIPESEWSAITHLVITHGDPDHHWNSDRIARVSGAHVICGKDLTRVIDGQTYVVDPRGRGLTSWVKINNLHPLDVGESVTLDNVRIEAVRSVHGPIAIPFLGFTIRKQPGPDERTGIGSAGFRITIDDTSILNLGDSILIDDWKNISADILMLPIGGLGNNTWTMDVEEALEAVSLIRPEHVIPCHYCIPLFWKRKFAVADGQLFRKEVESMGIKCTILKYGEFLEI